MIWNFLLDRTQFSSSGPPVQCFWLWLKLYTGIKVLSKLLCPKFIKFSHVLLVVYYIFFRMKSFLACMSITSLAVTSNRFHVIPITSLPCSSRGLSSHEIKDITIWLSSLTCDIISILTLKQWIHSLQTKEYQIVSFVCGVHFDFEDKKNAVFFASSCILHIPYIGPDTKPYTRHYANNIQVLPQVGLLWIYSDKR